MYTIRRGKPRDAEAIANLLIRSWQMSYRSFFPASFLDKLDLSRQKKRHTAYLEKGTSYFLIENEANKLLGFASYGKSRSTDMEAEFELYTLYVDPEMHRQGIGSHLLKAVLDESKANSSIGVEVFAENPYLAFYLNHGFHSIGEEMIDLGEFQVKSLILKKELL